MALELCKRGMNPAAEEEATLWALLTSGGGGLCEPTGDGWHNPMEAPLVPVFCRSGNRTPANMRWTLAERRNRIGYRS